MTIYRLISAIFALAAILALGGALIFTILGEPRNALFCAAISVLCGMLKFLHDQLIKPKNWSNSANLF